MKIKEARNGKEEENEREDEKKEDQNRYKKKKKRRPDVSRGHSSKHKYKLGNRKELIKHRSDLINGTGADNNKVIAGTIYGADFSIFTPPRRRLPREQVDLRSS